MQLNPPAKVRAVIYVVMALSAPVVVYLRSQNIIGDKEVTLYTGLVTVVSGLAAFNVSKS
jgi:hypothetical protein